MNSRIEYLNTLTIEQLNQELKNEGFLEYELESFNNTNWSFHSDKPFYVDNITDLVQKLVESKYFYINSLQHIELFTEEKAKEFLKLKILEIIG